MSPTLRMVLVVWCCTFLVPAGEVAGQESTGAETLKASTIPPRPAGAASGSEFGHRTARLTGPERQRQAVMEIVSGNVPTFLRQLVPLHLSRNLAGGEVLEGVVWVMPDYLAIGSDEDFLHIPLTYPSATAVANQFGFVLPTCRIVDTVFHQTSHHLPPEPLPPGRQMRSIEYYLKHRELIERGRQGIPLGELIAGHKKDVVLTRRLGLRPDRIAIYGWHKPDGKVIQPLSTVHTRRYADYSHGIRLVWGTMLVAGEEHSIYDVLADPVLAPLLSDEGTIPTARQLMHPSAAAIKP